MVVICRGKMDIFFCFVGNNSSNKFNRSKTFNIEPSVRYQKPTLLEHLSTQQHLDAVAAEHLQRVSDFHKELLTVKRQPMAFCSKFSLLFAG